MSIGEAVTINDPIRSERDLRRFEFVLSRPPVASGRAVVLVSASGATAWYSAERQPTRGELNLKNFRKLYEVDTGVHHLAFEHELPSAGDAFHFSAALDVDWHVVEPAVVVQRGVRDVRRLLERRLLATMRQETRRFAIEASAAAENAVQDALDAAAVTPIEGIEISCGVRLSLDSEAVQQYTALRGIQHAKAQQESRHELTRLESRQGQELTEEKARFFAAILNGDEVDRWGLQVAFNENDLPLALEAIRQDLREGRQNQLRMFEQLLAKGVLEEHMLDDAARLAVENLRSSLDDSARGRTRRQPLYREALEPSPDPEDEAAKDEKDGQ